MYMSHYSNDNRFKQTHIELLPDDVRHLVSVAPSMRIIRLSRALIDCLSIAIAIKLNPVACRNFAAISSFKTVLSALRENISISSIWFEENLAFGYQKISSAYQVNELFSATYRFVYRWSVIYFFKLN